MVQWHKCSGVSPVRDGLLVGVAPPFSLVNEPRLEWSGGLFSLDPDAAPCSNTQNQPSEPASFVIYINHKTSYYSNKRAQNTQRHGQKQANTSVALAAPSNLPVYCLQLMINNNNYW